MLTLAAFVVLAAAFADGSVDEESLATFETAPTTTAVPTEPPAAQPEATQGSLDDGSATRDDPRAAFGSTADAVGPEVANTDTEAAPTAAVDEYFVPNYVGAVDRSEYDADVSAALVVPTATPTVAPAPTATPQPAPTPQPEPQPTPTAAPPSEPEPDVEPSADAVDENVDDNGESDTAADTDPSSDDSAGDDDSGGGPTEAQWAALRQCESGGNYQIVSPSGAYRGAYQFSQGTWDSTASGAYPGLVGDDPAEATPAQQDKMARRLYDLRGAGPWPTCGRHLN